MFEGLVRPALGDLTADVKQKLIRELEIVGKGFVATAVADSVSRTVIKSLDGVVAAAVRSLPQEDAERLAAAYLAEVQDQLEQLSAALLGYLPHAVNVEQAKKSHGSKSAQANRARAERQSFIEGVRSEVKDTFKAIAGQSVED
jgi:hypothetical protein